MSPVLKPEIISEAARQHLAKLVEEHEHTAGVEFLVPRAIRALQDIQSEWPAHENNAYRAKITGDLITVCGVIDQLACQICEEDEEEEL